MGAPDRRHRGNSIHCGRLLDRRRAEAGLTGRHDDDLVAIRARSSLTTVRWRLEVAARTDPAMPVMSMIGAATDAVRRAWVHRVAWATPAAGAKRIFWPCRCRSRTMIW
jgi:hypothetical protein